MTGSGEAAGNASNSTDWFLFFFFDPPQIELRPQSDPFSSSGGGEGSGSGGGGGSSTTGSMTPFLLFYPFFVIGAAEPQASQGSAGFSSGAGSGSTSGSGGGGGGGGRSEADGDQRAA